MTTPAWTVRSLKTALSDGLTDALTARVVEGADPILLVTLHDQGDLEIFVSVSEQQIAASVLWRCLALVGDSEEDQAERSGAPHPVLVSVAVDVVRARTRWGSGP